MAGKITVRELVTKWGFDADTSKVEAFDKAIKRTKTAVNVATAALAGFAAVSVKSSATFEKSFAEVLTLMDLTAEQTDVLRKDILELSKEFGSMPTDTAKAFYSTISAGFSGVEDSNAVMRTGLKLAIGGVTDAQTALLGLTSVLNAYGLSAEQSGAVSDAMFVAMRAGQTTIGELASGIGKVSSIAAQTGVSYETLLAATAALTKGGIKTREAITYLRQVLVSVLKPTAEAAERAKELKKQFGFDFSIQAIRKKGLLPWMQELQAAVAGNDDAVVDLFGSVEALSAVMALAGKQSGDFAAIMKDMEVRTGATDKAVDKMAKTTAQRFAKAQATFEELKIELGARLLPVINDLLEGFGKFLDRMGGAEKVVDRIVAALEALVAIKVVSYFYGAAKAATAFFNAVAAGEAAVAAAGAGGAAAAAGGAAAGAAGAAGAGAAAAGGTAGARSLFGLGAAGLSAVLSTLFLHGDRSGEMPADTPAERRLAAFARVQVLSVNEIRNAIDLVKAIPGAIAGAGGGAPGAPGGEAPIERLRPSSAMMHEMLLAATRGGMPTMTAEDLIRMRLEGREATKEVNIDNKIIIDVPPGTSVEQADAIAKVVKQTLDTELGAAIRNAMNDQEAM